MKQNKFPVLLLTSGNTNLYDRAIHTFYDPRTATTEFGVAFVQSFYIKGLSLLVDDVQNCPGHIKYIRDRNITLFLWGDKLISKKQLKKFKKLGVNGFIANK